MTRGVPSTVARLTAFLLMALLVLDDARAADITFEGLAEDTQISTQYQAAFGVTFSIVGSPSALPIIAVQGCPVRAYDGGNCTRDDTPNTPNGGIACLTDPVVTGQGVSGFRFGQSIAMTFDQPITSICLSVIDLDSDDIVTVRALNGSTVVTELTKSYLDIDAGNRVETLFALSGPPFNRVEIVVPTEIGYAIDDICFKDSDGDGLLDDWELGGIPYVKSDGTKGRYVLPDANPYRKDVYVEVDSMPDRAPSLMALTRVLSAFDSAPVPAPAVAGGLPGIALHIVLDETIPFKDYPFDFVEFQQDRQVYFGTLTSAERLNSDWATMRGAKAKAFRYCIFGNSHGSGNSSGLAELCGNDFMVTLGRWQPPGGTEEEQAGTFMHELGHTLGLQHGGNQGDPAWPENPLRFNNKPNYFSVMNYLWQVPHSEYMPSGQAVGQWGYYFPNYSDRALPSLDESALNDAVGIQGNHPELWVPYSIPGGTINCQTGQLCQQPPNGGCIRLARFVGSVDWNNDCDPRSLSISALDINNVQPGSPGATPGDVLSGFNDWENLVYSFLGSPAYADGAVSVNNPVELDYDTHQSLAAFPPPPGATGDANCDGRLDGLDIQPFALAVVDPSSYATQHPYCNVLDVDMNGDRLVNQEDVAPFVSKLLAR